MLRKYARKERVLKRESEDSFSGFVNTVAVARKNGGGTVSRSHGESREDKEDDKGTVECPGLAHNFPSASGDARRVRVTASRRTRPSHRDWNTKNEPPTILLPFSRDSSPSPLSFSLSFSFLTP